MLVTLDVQCASPQMKNGYQEFIKFRDKQGIVDKHLYPYGNNPALLLLPKTAQGFQIRCEYATGTLTGSFLTAMAERLPLTIWKKIPPKLRMRIGYPAYGPAEWHTLSTNMPIGN